MSTDELLAEAPGDDVAEAWVEELERRSRDVSEGRVRTVSWESVRAEVMTELEQRRARRSAQ